MTKYVFVTGGVVSSLGKGIAAASLAAILESRGLKVTMIKLDPYINVDPGTMSPFQHGEVFVTEDGAETDLDLGGTMRLGRQEVPVKQGTLAHKIYGDVVAERHRHRYEVNNAYVAQFEEKGMVISAKTPTEHLPEMMELPNHPFFFAVQFHPEFTSSPRFGHPLFKAYIEAAIAHADSKKA